MTAGRRCGRWASGYEGSGRSLDTSEGTNTMALPALVEPAGELSRDEIFRYSRHLIIPDVAMDGQKRLKNASVLLIGAGGLGSPNAMYLAAAGVGHIGIVDFDDVDASNLQRQVIHGTSDIGRPKLESARDKIREINPYVEVTLHETRLTSENARGIIRDYDLIVDGSDNFPTRYLVNDACVLEGKPYVWGSIYRFDGQASVFWAEHGPCYRCLYPEPPPPGMVPSCAEGGVLGVLCATVGSVQANEAIKLITGIDVREHAEWQINRIPGAKLIPLGELPSRLTELPQTDPVVVYCKTGGRSAEALALLKQSGFSTARHLGGGIVAYVKTVDPSMAEY